MIKKIVFALIWAMVFFFQFVRGGDPSKNIECIEGIGYLWAFGPFVSGGVGSILGAIGKLPGTRNKKESIPADS